MFALARLQRAYRGQNSPDCLLTEQRRRGQPRRSSIAETAESRLRRSAYMAVGQVQCDFANGVLTLCGRLPSYYLKQIAQHAVADIEGIEEIVNQVEVVPATPRRS